MIFVLLTRDLMVVSRVEGTAASLDATVRSAADGARAIEICLAERPDCLLIDLATPELDIDWLLKQLAAEGAHRPRVVAFGPHVHAERLVAAREAGCDVVVSRGEFFARLASIIGG
jgi:CheY-like chemotaxis protein